MANPRPPPVNDEQKELLLGFMESNVLFSQGEFRCAMGKEDYRNEWERLAKELNAIPHGAIKSGPKWQIFWSDQRDAVKQRSQEVSLFLNRGTGGGPPTEQLTEYQQRVLTCMGGWKRVIGFSAVRDPLELRIDASSQLASIMKNSKTASSPLASIVKHSTTVDHRLTSGCLPSSARSCSRSRGRSSSSRSVSRSRGRNNTCRTGSRCRGRNERSRSVSRSRSRGRYRRSRSRSRGRNDRSRSVTRSRSRGRHRRSRSISRSRGRNRRSRSLSKSRSRGRYGRSRSISRYRGRNTKSRSVSKSRSRGRYHRSRSVSRSRGGNGRSRSRDRYGRCHSRGRRSRTRQSRSRSMSSLRSRAPSHVSDIPDHLLKEVPTDSDGWQIPPAEVVDTEPKTVVAGCQQTVGTPYTFKSNSARPNQPATPLMHAAAKPVVASGGQLRSRAPSNSNDVPDHLLTEFPTDSDGWQIPPVEVIDIASKTASSDLGPHPTLRILQTTFSWSSEETLQEDQVVVDDVIFT